MHLIQRQNILQHINYQLIQKQFIQLRNWGKSTTLIIALKYVRLQVYQRYTDCKFQLYNCLYQLSLIRISQILYSRLTLKKLIINLYTCINIPIIEKKLSRHICKQLAKNLKHIFFYCCMLNFFFKCYLPVCSGICAATNSLHSYMTKNK